MELEIEHSTAAGLSGLLRPRVGEPVRAPTLTKPSSSSSMLSEAVREMLAASRRNAAGKRPRGPCHPPAGPGNGNGDQMSCAAAKEAMLLTARTRQAPAKGVARRMLRRRGASPPAPDHGGTKVVLTCCCERLPPGLCCALHQRGGAPGRPWTRDGGGNNAVAREKSFLQAPVGVVVVRTVRLLLDPCFRSRPACGIPPSFPYSLAVAAYRIIRLHAPG
ncbi:hypothetical protein QYE76_026607 [Lolium multiflorum]|uniref:Uncharacterized protein n=1 Tax=Lolium multiflorum TaxID=4521 RepID=A0AAD8RGJ5_LOLMU|nr:hypothetical protein QYE76_026607 [Lolium multiflorum]